MPDIDGYPTEAELELITSWPVGKGFAELLSYVRQLWAYADWGWSEEEASQVETTKNHSHYYRYNISTAGWSGNESLIEALQRNHVFWAFCWYSSHRGGHFEFRVRKD